MKRLLLLLGARTYRASDFLSAAQKLGVEAIIASEEALPAAGLATGRILHMDLDPSDSGVEAICQAAREHPLDAIVAVDDRGIALAARASATLGLPSNPAESVVSAQNKRVFREICQSAGLATPWFREISLDDDPDRLARQVSYPCVLKPLHLSASRGVIRANDPAGFVSALQRVARILAREEVHRLSTELATRLLVEGYVEGSEAALEGLVEQGRFRLLAFFDKPEPLEGPFFQETIYVTPSRHSPRDQYLAEQAAQAAVGALGLHTGPVHAEVRIHRGEATLIDLAPRSIGGHCARALRFERGLSLEELILVQALGLDPQRTERERPAAGVLMIPIPAAGALLGVDGVDAARAIPGITDLEISIPAGQEIEPPPEGDRYLGFVFARAGTPERVEASLRAAKKLLQVKIQPTSGHQ